MGIIVRPDGSLEATSVEDALALQRAILAANAVPRRSPAPVPDSLGRKVDEAVREARTTRQAERDLQRKRASLFMDALERATPLTSPLIAKALGVAQGRGLGSVMKQVKKTIADLTGMSIEDILHIERSMDRSVGLVIKRGPKFGQALSKIMEATK